MSPFENNVRRVDTTFPAEGEAQPVLTPEQEQSLHDFCRDYVALLGMLYADEELNEWCHKYSPYEQDTSHPEMEELIHGKLVKDAYALEMPDILGKRPYSSYSYEAALAGTKFDIAYGICLEIRADYWDNGSLISHAVAEGKLYHLMCAFLGIEPIEKDAIADDIEPASAETCNDKPFSLAYIKSFEGRPDERRPGGRKVWHDVSMNKWRMTIQLDEERVWFLSVFVNDDGTFDKFSLDEELADDSHYEFSDEEGVRTAIYQPGDKDLDFGEVLVKYVAQCGGTALLSAIRPFITAQFHYY